MSDNFNQDFRAELAAANGGKVQTLKAPLGTIENSKAEDEVTAKELFGEDVLEGRIPAITQNFVMQKSKEDRLVEFGQLAQEVHTTQTVSRKQVLAIEEIARELVPATEGEDPKVVVSDYEVNMFTEEPSAVELDTVLNGSQATVDRVIGDLRTSAIELAEQLIKTAEDDALERNERLTKSIALFNRGCANFLRETNADSLENVQLRFRRDLDWGTLMVLSPESTLHMPDVLDKIRGTFAESFMQEMADLISKNLLACSVLRVFVSGKPEIIRNYRDSYNNLKATREDKQVVDSYNFTVGDLFFSFGNERFSAFYSYMLEAYSLQVNAAKVYRDGLNKATTLEAVKEASFGLHNIHQCIMDINSNLAILNAVQYSIIKFLNKF